MLACPKERQYYSKEFSKAKNRKNDRDALLHVEHRATFMVRSRARYPLMKAILSRSLSHLGDG